MDSKVRYALMERDMSSFMVSIGLGLMLETFFEPTSTRVDSGRVVNKANINNYKTHYYNIHTMLRNIIASLSSTEIRKLVLTHKSSPEALLVVLLDELEIIKSLYENTQCNPVIFVPDYSDVYKKIDNSHKPEGLNETKRVTKELYDKTIKLFLDMDWKIIDIYKIKIDLPSTSDNVLITTHITYDLLNVERIRRLTLVESHTGVLKDKNRFNTKYHSLGAKYDKTIFPFQRQLLHILGDNTLIKPFKISYRLRLAEKAMSNKWTSYTSENRVSVVIKELDKELA